jgi:hypothetical protein
VVDVVNAQAGAGIPAISLSKMQSQAPDLVSLYKTAGSSVRAHGLEGVRAAVYLVLDRSGSMRPYYKDGTMQHLGEQVLSLSAHLDDNEFAFLRRLDDLDVPRHRIVDNAGFFHAGRDPRAVPDDLLYSRLLQEFPRWLSSARTAQVLQ